MPELTLPKFIELEQMVLGTCIQAGIAPTLSPDCWYSAAHQSLVTAMQAMESEGQPINMITLYDRLRARQEHETVGGASYIAQLLDVAVRPDNVEIYQGRIKAAADARRLILACASIVSRSESIAAQPVTEWCGEIQSALDQIGRYNSRSEIELIAPIAKRVLADLEARRQPGAQRLLGTPTGLTDLDRMTSGLCPSDLIIVAGRPGMGKTALATQIAAHAAVSGKRVMVISLEMSREQIVTRILAQRTAVDIKDLRTGTLADRPFADVLTSAASLHDLQLYIDDAPELTEVDICHRARKIRPDLLIIDYLTLCRAARRETRRDLEVGNISRALKALAKRLGIPVVLLSQLNRSLESRNDKRPLPSDLRDSGAIEQDADVILLLYRDEVYNPDSKDAGIAEIIIGKQRNGPTGRVRTRFDAHCATFRDLAQRSAGNER